MYQNTNTVLSDALIGTPKCQAPNCLCILENLALKNVLLDCNWIVMRLQSQQWKTTRSCYFIKCFQFLITNANTKDMKTFSSCTYSASISLAVAKNIQEP